MLFSEGLAGSLQTFSSPFLLVGRSPRLTGGAGRVSISPSALPFAHMKKSLLCYLLAGSFALAGEPPIPASADGSVVGTASDNGGDNGGLTEATMLFTEFKILLAATSDTLRSVTDRASADAAADKLERLNDSLAEVLDKLLACPELAEGCVDTPHLREVINDATRFLTQIDEQTSDLEAKGFYGSDALRRALISGREQQ